MITSVEPADVLLDQGAVKFLPDTPSNVLSYDSKEELLTEGGDETREADHKHAQTPIICVCSQGIFVLHVKEHEQHPREENAE